MDIVSACLAGYNCKWNGENNLRNDPLLSKCFPVCPEAFGGLGIPRDHSEIQGNQVTTISGKDVTEEFNKGAQLALEVALSLGAKKAYLKQRSPSCGTKQVRDGTFTNTLVDGEGVFAKLLRENSIEVIGIE